MKTDIFPDYVVYFKKTKNVIELIEVYDLDEKKVDIELPEIFLDRATKYLNQTNEDGYTFLFFSEEHPSSIIINIDGIFHLVQNYEMK